MSENEKSDGAVRPREAEALAAHFIAALTEQEGPAPATIAEPLRRAVEEGERAWPSCIHPREDYVAHLARLLCSRTGPWPERFEGLRAADLYLASAACQGVDSATAVIQREHSSALRIALRKLGLSTSLVDEALQRTLTRVLVDTGEQTASIASYAGRGTLRSWLCAVAVRTGLKLAKASSKERSADDQVLEELPEGAPDPEFELLKESYRTEFAEALREAMAALSHKQRTLLRQHFVDGLSARELGRLYNVHHATTARWINAARETLREGTKNALIARLRVDPSEIDSLARLVRSRIDMSLHEFFATGR